MLKRMIFLLGLKIIHYFCFHKKFLKVAVVRPFFWNEKEKCVCKFVVLLYSEFCFVLCIYRLILKVR